MTALRFFFKNIFINVCIYVQNKSKREKVLVIIKKICLKIIFKMIHLLIVYVEILIHQEKIHCNIDIFKKKKTLSFSNLIYFISINSYYKRIIWALEDLFKNNIYAFYLTFNQIIILICVLSTYKKLRNLTRYVAQRYRKKT